MVSIKIHRGTKQIGGTITEIYTENTHIFIDFGSELNVDYKESTDAAMSKMIKTAECDAVLFSHYHGDHVGLMKEVPEKDVRGREIKLGMGRVARNVLINIHKTLSKSEKDDAIEHGKMLDLLNEDSKWIDFENKKVLLIGDFSITTVRVDHSAFDAYMFIIEAEGKTIVHTGDFRTHGRLGKKLFSSVEEAMAGKEADILIIEGTMMSRLDEEVLSEMELETKVYDELSKPENKWAFLVCSSTNMESLASFCSAARKLGRPFLVNRYVHAQIDEYRRTAGKEDWNFKFKKAYKFERMNRYIPKLNGTQPEFMDENGFLMLVGTSDAYKERMNYYKDHDPLLIYSMWDGYINEEEHPDTYDPQYGNLYKSWRHKKLHTSGHATAASIEKMIKTINPKKGIIPVHTTNFGNFKKLDIREFELFEIKDGEEYGL